MQSEGARSHHNRSFVGRGGVALMVGCKSLFAVAPNAGAYVYIPVAALVFSFAVDFSSTLPPTIYQSVRRVVRRPSVTFR